METTTTLVPIFQFDLLDDTIRERVIERDKQYDDALQRIQKSFVEIGRILIEQKKDLIHGQWSKWLESKRIKQPTANALMQIAEKFSNLPIIGDFKFKSLQFLAQDSTPESARIEAISRMQAGEDLTIKKTKEIIESHKRNEDGGTTPDTKLKIQQETTKLITKAAGLMRKAIQSSEISETALAMVRELIDELNSFVEQRNQ